MTKPPTGALPKGVYERADRRTDAGGIIQAKVRAGGRDISKTWPYLDNPPAGQRKSSRAAVIDMAAQWRAVQMHGITHLGGTAEERAARDAPPANGVALSEDWLGFWFAQYIADTSLTVRLDKADQQVAERAAREPAALTAADRAARDARLASYRAEFERLAYEKAAQDVIDKVPVPFVPLLEPIRHHSASAQRERDNAAWLMQNCPALMRKRVVDVGQEDIEDLLALMQETKIRAADGTMKRRWADNSIRLRIAVIQSVYVRAASVWRHPVNAGEQRGKTWFPANRATPVDLVKRHEKLPATDARKPQIISDGQWAAIMAEAGNTRQGTLAALHFLRATGARRGEAAFLQWSDLIAPEESDQTWQAWLRETKTPLGGENERTIPLVPSAMTAILEARQAHLLRGISNAWTRTKIRRAGLGSAADLEADLTAGRLRGSVFGYTEDGITQAWDAMRARAAEACDVRAQAAHARGDLAAVAIATKERLAILKCNVHDLRHTRLTEITSVMPIQKAMLISGHKTMKMLEHYYHAKPGQVGAELVQAEAEAAAKKAQRSAGRAT